MKYITTAMLVLIVVSVCGITIKDSEREFTLSNDELTSLPRSTVETVRRIPGNHKEDTWYGVLLNDILNHFDVKGFDRLVLTSGDNYQVRLTTEDLATASVLIAMQQNKTVFEEGFYRLIVPGKRSMFWIERVSNIATELYADAPAPDVIFFTEDLVTNMPQSDEYKGFEGKPAYDFMELLSRVYPFLEGEIIITARDGFTQQLDIQTYLHDSFLILAEDIFQLRGKNLPEGMSVKKISYIQFLDRAIIFRDRFESFSDVQELMGWGSRPESLFKDDDFSISTEESFKDPIWENSGRLRWIK